MTQKIKLTFLGTSHAIPTAKRNHTAILLNYGKENILIDCGEGTQRQFRKARLNPMRLTRILITHWHGDHVLGIPGLLQTIAFGKYTKTLFIYGPRGTRRFMSEMLKTFKFEGKIKMEIKEVESGKFFDEGDFYLECEKMTHGVPCNAYAFVKKGQRRIDKKKLEKSGLPAGPLIQKLKDGKDVVHKGKKYSSKNLTYEENGKKVSFVLDTSENKKIKPFVESSDVLVCESCYNDEMLGKAREHKHMTITQCAKIAKSAKVGKLILTHISQRYEKNLKKFLESAKKIFKNSRLVEDLDEVEI